MLQYCLEHWVQGPAAGRAVPGCHQPCPDPGWTDLSPPTAIPVHLQNTHLAIWGQSLQLIHMSSSLLGTLPALGAADPSQLLLMHVSPGSPAKNPGRDTRPKTIPNCSPPEEQEEPGKAAGALGSAPYRAGVQG